MLEIEQQTVTYKITIRNKEGEINIFCDEYGKRVLLEEKLLREGEKNEDLARTY